MLWWVYLSCGYAFVVAALALATAAVLSSMSHGMCEDISQYLHDHTGGIPAAQGMVAVQRSIWLAAVAMHARSFYQMKENKKALNNLAADCLIYGVLVLAIPQYAMCKKTHIPDLLMPGFIPMDIRESIVRITPSPFFYTVLTGMFRMADASKFNSYRSHIAFMVSFSALFFALAHGPEGIADLLIGIAFTVITCFFRSLYSSSEPDTIPPASVELSPVERDLQTEEDDSFSINDVAVLP